MCDWLTEFVYARISIDGEYYIPWNVMPQIWQEEKEAFDINTWKKSSLYSSVDTPEKYDDVIREFDKMLESHGVKRKNIIYQGENTNDTIAIFCHFGLGMVLASHLTGISSVLL